MKNSDIFKNYIILRFSHVYFFVAAGPKKFKQKCYSAVQSYKCLILNENILFKLRLQRKYLLRIDELWAKFGNLQFIKFLNKIESLNPKFSTGI